MALIVVTGTHTPSIAHYGLQMAGEAGEAIVAGYACLIKSDGKVYHAGTTVVTGTTAVGFDGFSAYDAASGEPVTLLGNGCVLNMDENAGLTPGKDLWLSATAGVLSDAKIAGTDQPVARAISARDIRVLR